MTTATVLTLHLSILLGIYMLAAGLGGLIDRTRWEDLLAELERSQGLLYLLAIIAFAAGAVIVSLHNLWTDPLAILVTLIGWAALAEAILLFVRPALWFALARPFLKHLRVFAIVTILIGALLLAAGLTGHADPLLLDERYA